MIQVAGISPIRVKAADDATDCGTSSLELRSVSRPPWKYHNAHAHYRCLLTTLMSCGLTDADGLLGDTSELQELAKMPKLTRD